MFTASASNALTDEHTDVSDLDISELERLAEEGDGFAQYALYGAYIRGLGDKRKKYKWAYWLKKSAMQDVPPALFDLGTRLLVGMELEQNEAAGVLLLESAAQKGNTDALVIIGEYFINPKKKYSLIDALLAERYFRIAASFDHPGAMRALGYMYQQGMEAEADPDDDLDISTAINWYQRAAELGDYRSAAGLAFIYSQPHFEIEDYEKAYFWLKVVEFSEVVGLTGISEMLSEVSEFLNADVKKTLDSEAQQWLSTSKSSSRKTDQTEEIEPVRPQDSYDSELS